MGIAREGRNGRFLLLALGLLVVLPSLFTRDLWNPDEPRYAEVAREMRVLGQYAVPHLNGEVYSEKPPLYFWLSALLQGLGLGLGAGRLATGAAAIGTLWLTFALARAALAERSALVAPLCLVTSLMFLLMSKAGTLDVPLCFFTTLAVYAWLRARSAGAWLVVFYVAMALATLTKGPLGMLIPLLFVASMKYCGCPCGPSRARHVLWGVPLVAAILLAWLVPAHFAGGREFTETILLRQIFGRMVSSWSHARPWYYYLANLPINFLPWTIFVPFALYEVVGSRRPDGALPRAMALAFVLGFVIFSAISGKRERYLVPLLPPLAIVVAAWIERALAAEPAARARRTLATLLGSWHAVVAIGLTAPLFLVAGRERVVAAAGDKAEVARAVKRLLGFPDAAGLLAVSAVGVALGALGFVLVRRGRLSSSVTLVAAQVLWLSVSGDLLLVGRVNEFKSARPVAERVNERVPPGGPGQVALYRESFGGALNLYTGRLQFPLLRNPAAAREFLALHPDNAVIANGKDLDAIQAAIDEEQQALRVGAIGSTEVWLVYRRGG